MPGRPKWMTTEDRFWEKVQKTDTCWLWTGALARGYGKFWSGTRLVHAHRWAYEQTQGPIPDGMTLDHLCRTKNCVRSDHIEVVTGAENTRRFFRVRPRVTHCPKGHPYSGKNVTKWGSNKASRCVTCQRERYYLTYPLKSGKRKLRKVPTPSVLPPEMESAPSSEPQ